MRDYGIRVLPRLQQSPLWRLSARAFRLWVYLAMKAQHAPRNVVLSDGQRIRVLRGQWLTSVRKLRKEVGGSLRTVLSNLIELRDAGVIELRPIARFQNANGGVTENRTGGVLKTATLNA